MMNDEKCEAMEPQIQQDGKSLTAAIENLNDAIAQVITKCATVCFEPASTPSTGAVGSNGASPQPHRSPIAQAIRNAADDINDAALRIRRLTNQIQL